MNVMKNKTEVKSHMVRFRLTKTEYHEIQMYAGIYAHGNVSELCRYAVKNFRRKILNPKIKVNKKGLRQARD